MSTKYDTASGIGRESGFIFAEKGAAGVLFADINESGAADAAAESKKYASNASYKAASVRLDVTDHGNVRDAVARAVQEFGRLDYAVHCAGVGDETWSSL